MEITEAKILKLMPNVLLISPSLRKAGGVSEFNKLLLQYGKTTNVEMFSMKSGLSQSGLKFVCLIIDYLRYIYILSTKKVDIIHVGPSLNKQSIQRDAFYVFLAKLFNKPVFVHWHGWNPAYEYLLSRRLFLKHTLFKANHIKILSSDFKKKIINAGFRNKITLGNTLVDDKLLGHNVTKKNISDFNVLFLATLSVNKGIYLTLDAFKNAHGKNENICLTVAGEGPEFENAQLYVIQHGIKKVSFIRHVENLKKAEAFTDADLYIFPSKYEGMPTSVLEAMTFGLPVICNRVGALVDFFENGRMGMAFEDGTSKDFADYILRFADDSKLCEEVGAFNMEYARSRFLASKGIERIEREYYLLAYPERS